MELKTERLFLRTITEADVAIVRDFGKDEFETDEAAQAVVQFAFEKAGQDMLVAIVKIENIASRSVVKKLGFSNYGVRIVPDENGENCKFDYFRLYRNDLSVLT